MSTFWNIFRKPFIWKPLFVLSVIGINLVAGSGWGDLGLWTFFSIILAICINKNRTRVLHRGEESYETYCTRQRLRYGFGDVRTFTDRKNRFGF